jgi:uncharacterized membrane protein YfcA
VIEYVIAAPLGVAVGIVLGLTGAGGAILSVPLLTLVLHMSIVEAAPIGLFAVAVSAGVGAALSLRRRILRYKAASLMAAAGAIASPLGIWAAYQIPNRPLAAAFSLLLVWIGVNTWRQSRKSPAELAAERAQNPPPCRLNPATGKLRWTMPCARALAGSGLMAGFLSGLLGVGGGFIIIPSLRKYTDLEMSWVVATSMGVLTLISALGVVVAAMHAPINLHTGLPFIGGAVVGMLGGRYYSERLAGPSLQKAFAVLALGVAIAMGVKAALFM